MGVRAAHAAARRPALVLVLLVLYAPRQSRSQFGGWGSEAAAGGARLGADPLGDNGPQLGKLTDPGPQLGKLPGTGGGAAHASGDDGKQAIQDMLQKQLGTHAARGHAGAGGGAGAGLGDDMSSFFKQRPAPAAPDPFEPSELAPGGGGGSGAPGSAGHAGGAGFDPSRLAPSHDEGVSAGARQDGAGASRGGSGPGGAPAGSAGQKPRPWETGSSARAEGAGGRGSKASSVPGSAARDTLEDLESLSQNVAAQAKKKGREPEKAGKKQSSWLDAASSWFKGEGAGKGKSTGDKTQKKDTKASKKSSGKSMRQMVCFKIHLIKSSFGGVPSHGATRRTPSPSARCSHLWVSKSSAHPRRARFVAWSSTMWSRAVSSSRVPAISNSLALVVTWNRSTRHCEMSSSCSLSMWTYLDCMCTPQSTAADFKFRVLRSLIR